MQFLPDINLHIVGDGPEKKTLEKLSRKLSLKNVYFKGKKSGKEVEKEYKNE